MKKSGIFLSALAISLAIVFSSAVNKPKRLQHVVAFSYKPDVTEEQKAKVIAAFYALKADIAQIIAFEGGADIQPKAGKKFTQCFVVTVKDEKDLEIYGNHPKHQAFSAMVLALVNDVMVVDYWKE